MTTIEVPKSLHDRLQRLAEQDGLTLAQEIEHLMDRAAARPRVEGRRGRPLKAEETDDQHADGSAEG